jgi:hypothetical protein
MNQSSVSRLAFGLALLCLAVLGTTSAAQTSEPDPVFEASGFQKNRPYFSQLPFENIDMVSGNLVLTFTDLVLPGNAGMDVRVQRTFNHNGRPKWSFGLAGIPLLVRSPDGPTQCGFEAKSPRFITRRWCGARRVPTNILCCQVPVSM